MRIYLAVFLVLWLVEAIGQLSPGPLAKPHSHLEGLSNCLKCHELGSKVSDQKCLDCHVALKARVRSNKGYHVSKEVKGKKCAECHSDHHGIQFQMVRFETKSFDHDLTGYILEGSHETVDCRDCHKAGYIKDLELRKKTSTYLGLNTECLSCHEDYHQGTLDKKCLDCHDMKAFTPATRFDHAKTNYPLKGLHSSVDCIECHEKETKNGKEFQRFSEIKHSGCADCHLDVHQGSLGNQCTACHTEQGFSQLNRQFDHRKTGFILKGAHTSIDCRTCHKADAPHTGLFKEFKNIGQNDCKQCHTDVHDGKFGADCKECHNENSFKIKNAIDLAGFDHNRTHFPLKGSHAGLECKSCHKESLTSPLPHNRCDDCHDSYHTATFTLERLEEDCRNCHSESGFSPSLFTFEDHQRTTFPLLGAHQATPCILCHMKDEEWVYKSLDSDCISCHNNIHSGYLDDKYYPDQDCRACHSEDIWTNPAFDHNQTRYELSGSHASVACVKCHLPDNSFESRAASPVFRVSSECHSCHQDIHRGQFADAVNMTQCNVCHVPVDWEPVLFNHDSTRFILDGAHIDVACKECHYSVEDEAGSYVLYSLKTIACSDCH